jgi:hypothetical protein
MRDLVFQNGKPRIVEERRQPEKEARSTNAGGTFLGRTFKRSESLILFTECSMNGCNVRLIDIALG